MTRRAKEREAGFTLLELLVAMTLLGLVMAMLFGGLRLGVRVWETGETRAEERAGVAVGQRFVRDVLSRTHPMVRSDRRNVRKIAFDGRAERIEIAALMPPHLSPGGFNHVVVEVTGDGDRRRLAVRFAPVERDEDSRGELRGAEDADETVLIDGIATAAFSYYGSRRPREEPAWRDDWRDAEILPRLVRLRVAFADGDRRHWPDLFIAPRNAQGWDRNFLRRNRGRPR